METEVLNSNDIVLFEREAQDLPVSTSKPFIQANTIEGSFEDIKQTHVIPVFVKDNEPVISHSDFIEITLDAVSHVFHGETILKPSIRLSHPIKGRIPEARLKPAIDLLEHERTLYYERMAFVIEVPTIHADIGGNLLSLTIGGIKAYNLDNLYNKKGSDEHFKVFIGFQNRVCANLCVWSDGYVSDLKVKNTNQLIARIRTLIESYNANFHIHFLKRLNDFSLTENQFAHMIGRCRMYNHLPAEIKGNISPLLLNDTQLGTVVKDFYSDHSFCKDEEGNINLWKLYNLFTSSNKSSYIDTFLDRSVNAFDFVNEISDALEKSSTNWFLN